MTDVDLWLWPLHVPCPGNRTALLSADEVARADRFVNPDHGNAFRNGRGRLREILALYTQTDPTLLVFETGSMGKPKLNSGPSFNLSHSGGWALLAVAHFAPMLELGIDIEIPRPVERDLPDRFFAPAEAADLRGLQGDSWIAAFFRGWTRKEAVIKAVGDGLSIPLDSFRVSMRSDQPAAILEMIPSVGRASDWQLTHLDPGHGLVGAVAARSATPLRVTWRSQN